MCEAYGIPDPGTNDNPTEVRSSALAFVKKAISYFMPNKLMSLNALANSPVGNPTKFELYAFIILTSTLVLGVNYFVIMTRPLHPIRVHASHATCLDTRRSVTGILILLRNAPIFFYSKRQNTVESPTYGSELVAMNIAIENLLGLRYKLRMRGMHMEKCSTLLGDNNSMIVNTHNSVAFHGCRLRKDGTY